VTDIAWEGGFTPARIPHIQPFLFGDADGVSKGGPTHSIPVLTALIVIFNRLLTTKVVFGRVLAAFMECIPGSHSL